MRTFISSVCAFLLLAIFGGALPASARPPCANELSNGSFEDPVLRDRSYAHEPAVVGWRLASGTMFEIQRNIMGRAAQGEQYIELASNARTTVRQPVGTSLGETYQLSFAYSPRPGNRDNAVEVRWGSDVVSRLSGDGAGKRATEWQEHRFTLQGYGRTGMLEFADVSAPDAAGGFIDNVRLCRIACDELLSNGSFEDPVLRDRSYAHEPAVVGWRLASGTMFEIQRNIMGRAAQGEQYIELASNARTTVRQPVGTSPGETYQLSFAYSPRPGNRDNAVEVRWGSDVVARLSADGAGKRATEWQEHRFTLRGSGRTRMLEFADVSAPDAAGGFIDNVRLCRLSRSEVKGAR